MTMTDDELWYRAREVKEQKDRLATLKTGLSVLEASVVAAMLERGFHRVENDDGLKVTVVAGDTTEYPYSAFVSTFGAGVAESLRPDKIDKDKLAEAIQDGVIDPAKAAQLVRITPKTPYVRVT